MNRRKFIHGTSTTALAGFSITTSARAAKPKKQVIIGEGDYQYEVIHDWAQLPDKYTWQTTHNVAVDRDGFLYVMHEGVADQPDHPSIFVFDPEGKFVRAFGNQFQGGGHGIEVRDEGGEQFIYATGYQQVKAFSKMTLTGKEVWTKYAPMDSGVYAANEDTKREKIWGRDRFMPTNFAFLDDGGFLLADGYGAWCIHRYDKDGNWISKFGNPGQAAGEFRLPHGLWIDKRGGKPSVVVCDRSNNRVQWLDMEGNHLKTMNGFYLPANIDILGDTMLIPDLSARITLLDKNDKPIHLAESTDWRKEVLKDNKVMRRTPSSWKNGKFVHPHDACFDTKGNIYVAEWVATGRISKLKKI